MSSVSYECGVFLRSYMIIIMGTSRSRVFEEAEGIRLGAETEVLNMDLKDFFEGCS